MSAGVVPGRHSFNALLEAHAAAADVQGAAANYEMMKDHGIKADHCTFIALFMVCSCSNCLLCIMYELSTCTHSIICLLCHEIMLRMASSVQWWLHLRWPVYGTLLQHLHL